LATIVLIKVEALSSLLTSHSGLAYQQGKRDMVAMFHTVMGDMPDGTQVRVRVRVRARVRV
jgi:hypothetical protein